MTMTKEYRSELRDLKAQERELAKGLLKVAKEAKRQIAAITKGLEREYRSVRKHCERIAKRRAIIEGRLS